MMALSEEPDEDLIRSATPRGFGDGTARGAGGGGGAGEVHIPWTIPKAKVFQQSQNWKMAVQPEYDLVPLVYGRKGVRLPLATAVVVAVVVVKVVWVGGGTDMRMMSGTRALANDRRYSHLPLLED